MKKNKLLKIYELYMNQGLTLFQGYEQRLSFFTGLISAVIGGIVYCFLSISRFPSFSYVVPFGLIFLISISELAIWSTKRLYKQLLENITVLAKIEFDLGMTMEREKSDSKKDGTWWKSESYIIQRYKESRKKYVSSGKFVDEESKKGYQKSITIAFRSVYLIFTLIAIIILILSI